MLWYKLRATKLHIKNVFIIQEVNSNYSVWHLHCISQIVQMETSTLGQMFSHSCFMEVFNVQWSVSAQFA